MSQELFNQQISLLRSSYAEFLKQCYLIRTNAKIEVIGINKLEEDCKKLKDFYEKFLSRVRDLDAGSESQLHLKNYVLDMIVNEYLLVLYEVNNAQKIISFQRYLDEQLITSINLLIEKIKASDDSYDLSDIGVLCSVITMKNEKFITDINYEFPDHKLEIEQQISFKQKWLGLINQKYAELEMLLKQKTSGLKQEQSERPSAEYGNAINEMIFSLNHNWIEHIEVAFRAFITKIQALKTYNSDDKRMIDSEWEKFNKMGAEFVSYIQSNFSDNKLSVEQQKARDEYIQNVTTRFDEATQIARGVITEKYYEANPRDNLWSFWRANDSLHEGEFFSGADPSQEAVTFASEEMGFGNIDLDETRVNCLTM